MQGLEMYLHCVLDDVKHMENCIYNQMKVEIWR